MKNRKARLLLKAERRDAIISKATALAKQAKITLLADGSQNRFRIFMQDLKIFGAMHPPLVETVIACLGVNPLRPHNKFMRLIRDLDDLERRRILRKSQEVKNYDEFGLLGLG